MVCPECTRSNPIENKFCGSCGTALTQREKPQLRESVVASSETDPSSSAIREDGVPHLASDVAARNEVDHRDVRDGSLDAETHELPPREHDRIREAARGIEERTRAAHADTPRNSAGYGGGSILGLQGDSGVSGPDYLLEEDDAPRRGVNWTAVVGIVLLLAVAGAMLAAWKQAGFDGIRQSASDFWHQRLMKEQKTSAAKPGAEQPATGGQGGATSSSQPMPANPTDAGNSQPTMTSENSAPAAPAQAAANNAVGSSPSASDAKPESDQVSSDTDKKAKAASEGKPAPAASPSAKSDEADAATASTPADGEAKTLTHSATANRPRTEPAQDLYDKGQSYLLGRGVPQSCPQALVFTRAAAREGSFRAATQLGALYATGRCVEIDRVQAYRWFSQAQQLDPTNSWVERNRDSLWAQMTEEQRIQAGKE